MKITKGTINLALTYDLGTSTTTAVTVLQDVKPQALLPFHHPLAKTSNVSLADPAGFPLILSDQAASWRHIVELFSLNELRRSGVLPHYSDECATRFG